MTNAFVAVRTFFAAAAPESLAKNAGEKAYGPMRTVGAPATIMPPCAH